MRLLKFTSLSLLLLTFFTVSAFGQFTKKEERAIEKAEKHASKQEYSKAAEIILDLIKDKENSTRLWNLAVNYKYKNYLLNKDKKLNFTITTTTADGKPANDSLSKSLEELFSNMSLGKIYYNEFISICKEAERRCEYPTSASMYLRNLFIDEVIDSMVSEKALKFFNKAETEFENKNYDDAAKYYRKALEIDPGFYKAKLYLGDVYYAMEDYGKAAIYFREAMNRYPNQLEPRKYLVDALSNIYNYDEAYSETVDAILVYPDATLFWKLEDLSTLKNKKYNRHWMPRPFPVHSIADTSFNEKAFKEVENSPWKYYAEAKKNIVEFCDKDGIIKTGNPVTKQKYLEAYCWEYMLSKTDDAAFDFAREMQKKDMLDCYVLFGLSQFELYKQANHLAKTNPGKVKDFLTKELASY